MATLNLTRIPNLCPQSFGDVLQLCLSQPMTPNHIGGVYGISGQDLWSGFYQSAQQAGRAHQLEGRYFVLKLDEEDVRQLGPQLWQRLEKAARELISFASDYPAVYAIHENPAAPEIHILLSNIALSPGGYHLTNGAHYAYDGLIMNCMAEFILSDLCKKPVPVDCVRHIYDLAQARNSVR